MKKGTVLTILLAVVVLLSGMLFANFLLPQITESGDGVIVDVERKIRLTNPQEIITEPTVSQDPQEVFPYLFEDRTKLSRENLAETELQNRKVFVANVSSQVDILFNLKIGDVIMENYADVWRYTGEENPHSVRDTSDLFSVDIVFTDARSVRWRITASGYSDQIVSLSCYEDGVGPIAPPAITTDRLRDPRELYEEEEEPVNRFLTQLETLPTISRVSESNLYLSERIAVPSGQNTDLVWMVLLESDENCLVAGFAENNMQPICYIYANLNRELGYDFLWQVKERYETW